MTVTNVEEANVALDALLRRLEELFGPAPLTEDSAEERPAAGRVPHPLGAHVMSDLRGSDPRFTEADVNRAFAALDRVLQDYRWHAGVNRLPCETLVDALRAGGVSRALAVLLFKRLAEQPGFALRAVPVYPEPPTVLCVEPEPGSPFGWPSPFDGPPACEGAAEPEGFVECLETTEAAWLACFAEWEHPSAAATPAEARPSTDEAAAGRGAPQNMEPPPSDGARPERPTRDTPLTEDQLRAARASFDAWHSYATINTTAASWGVDPALMQPDSPSHVVWKYGERSYSIDGRSPVVVSVQMAAILDAFLAAGAALDTPTLEKHVENVSRVIDQLEARFPGAVRQPKRKGEGYYIRVQLVPRE
jgi:hypothetical protein